MQNECTEKRNGDTVDGDDAGRNGDVEKESSTRAAGSGH